MKNVKKLMLFIIACYLGTMQAENHAIEFSNIEIPYSSISGYEKLAKKIGNTIAGWFGYGNKPKIEKIEDQIHSLEEQKNDAIATLEAIQQQEQILHQEEKALHQEEL